MNLVIFAGGTGTRLWPLSRKNSPKQFALLKGDTSTLQMAIDRISLFGLENVYISTNEKYADFIREQVPSVSADHVLTEPAKRDLAAAIGLTLLRLKKNGASGAMTILWADHFMERPEAFVAALKKGEKLVEENPEQFVFLGEKPRYANHTLGWIHIGDEVADGQRAFVEWKYRPEVEVCKEMFASGEWLWNPGYFIFDIDYCILMYQKHQPEMFKKLQEMVDDESKLASEYETLESLSFDNAIVEHLVADQAVVLPVDLGWSDPGTLYALKEAFAPSTEENYLKGNVTTFETKDSFVYNEEDDKLVATIGLEGVCVVNTKDATLVVKKEDVPKIKELLKQLEVEGLEQYL